MAYIFKYHEKTLLSRNELKVKKYEKGNRILPIIVFQPQVYTVPAQLQAQSLFVTFDVGMKRNICCRGPILESLGWGAPSRPWPTRLTGQSQAPWVHSGKAKIPGFLQSSSQHGATPGRAAGRLRSLESILRFSFVHANLMPETGQIIILNPVTLRKWSIILYNITKKTPSYVHT